MIKIQSLLSTLLQQAELEFPYFPVLNVSLGNHLILNEKNLYPCVSAVSRYSIHFSK